MGITPYPAWVCGQLFEPGAPSFDVADEGLLLGLSIFDSLLWDEGCVLFFEQHMERFESGIRQLGIQWPLPWEPRAAVDELILELQRRFGGQLPKALMLRLTATRGVPGRGASLAVTVRECDALPAGGVTVALAGEHKAIGDPVEMIKSTNRLRNVLAREAGRKLGAWEVLFATTEGDISEGTISNLFAVVPGEGKLRLVTADEQRGCLGGIVRSLVIGAIRDEPLEVDGMPVQLEVGRLSRGALEAATELFLTNTTQRVIPVKNVLGSSGQLAGQAGSVTRAIAKRIGVLEGHYRLAH
ncbi:MAG: aminotransferase class IV [Planctomycetota bacterium]|jgi:branched-chain amino acid aminotransferase|nr:aminotransferase class IV [Planctomycetota bacterium]MDG2144271.1 aminotransferase class IV [Planctomycetota bacterium]